MWGIRTFDIICGSSCQSLLSQIVLLFKCFLNSATLEEVRSHKVLPTSHLCAVANFFEVLYGWLALSWWILARLLIAWNVMELCQRVFICRQTSLIYINPYILCGQRVFWLWITSAMNGWRNFLFFSFFFSFFLFFFFIFFFEVKRLGCTRKSGLGLSHFLGSGPNRGWSLYVRKSVRLSIHPSICLAIPPSGRTSQA